jgi:trimethylamine corrinoid protein
MSEAIFKMAHEAIIKADLKQATQALEEAKKANIPVFEVLNKGFAKGMVDLGEMYTSGEVFLPELVLSAKVMTMASEYFEAEMKKEGKETKKKGKVVFATVAGDVHDIGKGICCTMLRTSGMEVYDLGRDVSVDDIINKAEEVGADIIGTSTLLTTTMKEMDKLEKELKARGLRDKYKTMVGGAPVTMNYAKKIGADAYGNDAIDCVKIAVKLLEEKKS